MKIKSLRSFKIIAIVLSFLLVFEQSGFAQVAGELDISRHFFVLRNSFIQDKFRPIHLRYLSYDPSINNFNLLLDKGDFVKRLPLQGVVPEQEIKAQTKELLSYFFIGISLPNEVFWVNLRPDSPNNIIDSEVAETDVGRILLEADLQLKKDTANFTSPQTPEGKDYWDKLYKRAEELYGDENITIPTLTRPWIVPDEIIIRESSDNAYIYKATLKVMLEQDYLKDSAVYNFTDERSKVLNEYSSELIRNTIIPRLTREINSSKRYAPLRQVYYSLILAQWFKQKFYGKSGLYSYLIDKHKLEGLTSKSPWSKTTYFNAYKTSFQQGEYNIKEPRYAPYGQTIRSYMSGGIAFGEQIPRAFVPIKGNPKMPKPLFIWKQSSIIEMEARKLVPEAQALGDIKDLWGVDIKSIGSAAATQEVVASSPAAIKKFKIVDQNTAPLLKENTFIPGFLAPLPETIISSVAPASSAISWEILYLPAFEPVLDNSGREQVDSMAFRLVKNEITPYQEEGGKEFNVEDRVGLAIEYLQARGMLKELPEDLLALERILWSAGLKLELTTKEINDIQNVALVLRSFDEKLLEKDRKVLGAAKELIETLRKNYGDACSLERIRETMRKFVVVREIMPDSIEEIHGLAERIAKDILTAETSCFNGPVKVGGKVKYRITIKDPIIAVVEARSVFNGKLRSPDELGQYRQTDRYREAQQDAAKLIDINKRLHEVMYSEIGHMVLEFMAGMDTDIDLSVHEFYDAIFRLIESEGQLNSENTALFKRAMFRILLRLQPSELKTFRDPFIYSFTQNPYFLEEIPLSNSNLERLVLTKLQDQLDAYNWNIVPFFKNADRAFFSHSVAAGMIYEFLKRTDGNADLLVYIAGKILKLPGHGKIFGSVMLFTQEFERQLLDWRMQPKELQVVDSAGSPDSRDKNASSAINDGNARVNPLGHSVILEFCINYLRERNFIITESNENEDEVIIVKTSAFNYPDETTQRSADVIRNWAEQVKKEGKAIRFQGTNGKWITVKFESDPGGIETKEHKQQKAGYEEQNISWQEEIVNIAGARLHLICDRLGISFEQMDSWKRSNPDKARILQERLKEISEGDEQRQVYLQSIDSKYVIVGRNEPSFQHLYSETEEIVKRLLIAAGFNPDNFNLYLLDSTTVNAFVLNHVNDIFVNIGLIKFVIENGGSKDALAFVLAHEIRHILQWVDDVVAGKPLKRGLSGIVGRHADEYDADNDLALIDKAGYSVKDAEFFFAKFLEKKGKSTRLSLGFLTHPPTETRLRKIQRNISKFFWLNFFNKAEYFSNESKQELNNRTRHRLFQLEALTPWAAFDSVRKLSKNANNPEEYIFLLYAQARNLSLTSDIKREIKEYFVNRFAAGNQAKQKAFEVVIDIVIADLVSMQSGMVITRGGGIQNHKVAQDTKIKFESASLKELIELLSPSLILPLMSYRYIKAAQSYAEDGNFPDFNYTDLIGILCYAASERLRTLFSSGEVNINGLMELMKLFRQRYLEAEIYAGMAIPQDVNNFLEKLISMSLVLLLGNSDKTREIEYLGVVLSYFDMFEAIRNVHGSSVSFITDLCEYLMRADKVAKQFLVDNWLLKGDGGSELKDDFFARMLSIDFCGILPGMGKSAESDIDILFNNTYFREHVISGYTLAKWIKLLSQKYNLSHQDSIKLYERVLNQLSTLALSQEKERGFYNDLFKCITDRGAFSFKGNAMEVIKLEGIDERINELDDIPKDIHPELKRLIYFYRLGGVLSFGSTALEGGLRDVLMRIKMRSDKGDGPLLKKEDVEVFHSCLLSQKSKIKQRYTDETEIEKEMRWGKYILPLALYVSFDQEALSEDEYRYENTKPKKVGVIGEDGKSKIEIRPGKPNRFGRFIGEFSPLGVISRFFSRDDYQKTKVARGRGINRVFLTGENVDALLQVFNYIATSDKGFEVLSNEVLRALPATTYRNLALYVLFVEKFIREECGASIDVNKMFNLEYMQNMIGHFSSQQKTKAYQILNRISSLMVRDVEMEQLNEPNENVLSRLDDAEKQRISTEHLFEKKSYYPFEFTELGGALSQIDIFVGLLAEHNILEALKSAERSFNEKLDLVLNYFPRNSSSRDRFLNLLIENNMDMSTSADIEKILPLFNNNNFREKYAVLVLEKRRSENPVEFSTLDGELKCVLHYLPELSLTRDDILLQLIDEKANTPNDMKKIRPYLLRAPENIREKEQSQVVFGASVFEEYMKNQNAADKMEFLLWVMGISENKPFFLKRFEHEYNVSLDGMRRNLMDRKPGHYKNVGDSALEEFLEKILLGENGILYDAVVSGIFLSTLFDTLMPSQKNNLAGAVYDAVFHKADVNRQCAIVTALLMNFLKEKGTAGRISEGRAIRIFLGALGLIGVKIAQFLSTYEIVPEDIRGELKLLKDRAPQLNKDIAFDMVAKIYGSFEDSPVSEILECIGSASIKVVYRARLKDGREIVIKIKRPEVEKKVEEDLAFLRDILSDPAVEGALRDNNIEMPKQLSNRIAEMILEEMDLKGEVENQDRLRESVNPPSSFRRKAINRIFGYFISKTFKIPQKKYQFKVPATIDVQNNTLIIEDFVSGKRIEENDEDAMIAVARELMRQIFIEGFYHADPHTGNIFVGIDGETIYFIDVGSASQISLKNRYILYQLMKAIQNSEGKNILKIINKLSGKNIPDLVKTADDIAASKENVIKKIIMVFKVLEDYQVAIDKELVSIFRCFGQGESLFRAALLPGESASSAIAQASTASSSIQITRAQEELAYYKQLKENGPLVFENNAWFLDQTWSNYSYDTRRLLTPIDLENPGTLENELGRINAIFTRFDLSKVNSFGALYAYIRWRLSLNRYGANSRVSVETLTSIIEQARDGKEINIAFTDPLLNQILDKAKDMVEADKSSSSALSQNENNIEDARQRYKDSVWVPLLDSKNILDKIRGIVSTNIEPDISEYKNIVQGLEETRAVVKQGSFLSDAQISLIKAAWVYLRLLKYDFTAQERESMFLVFPASDDNPLTPLSPEDFVKFVIELEINFLVMMKEALSDQKRFDESSEIDALIKEREESWGYHPWVIEKLVMKDLDTRIRTMEEIRFDTSKIFAIGGHEQLQAHGARRLLSFLNIVLEGQLRDFGDWFIGLLRDGDPAIYAGPHGPYYALVKQGVRERPNQHSDFSYYLVPDTQVKNFVIDILNEALRQGLISSETRESELSKIKTYREFADEYEKAHRDKEIVASPKKQMNTGKSESASFPLAGFVLKKESRNRIQGLAEKWRAGLLSCLDLLSRPEIPKEEYMILANFVNKLVESDINTINDSSDPDTKIIFDTFTIGYPRAEIDFKSTLAVRVSETPPDKGSRSIELLKVKLSRLIEIINILEEVINSGGVIDTELINPSNYNGPMRVVTQVFIDEVREKTKNLGSPKSSLGQAGPASSSVTEDKFGNTDKSEAVSPQWIFETLRKIEKQVVDEERIYTLADKLREAFKWDDYFGHFTLAMWIELLRCKGVNELRGEDIKDGMLIKQGDIVKDEQAMFLIVKGGVRVSEDTHSIWIADLEEGNYIGEIGAGSLGKLRTATVRIKEGESEAEFLAIPMSVFSALGLSRVFSEISRQRSNRLKSRERLAENDFTRILKEYPDYGEDSPVTKTYNLALKIINPKTNPLSADVTFHNPYHWNELLAFVDAVISGMGNNIKNREAALMLSRVAAYLHDIGYYLPGAHGKFTVVGHEDRSAKFVEDNKEELGLNNRYARAIQFMIELTKMKIGDKFRNELGRVNEALTEMRNGKISDKTISFLMEILPDLDLNLASDLNFANDTLIAAKALAVADLYAATVDMVSLLWLEFKLESSPAGRPTMIEQIADSGNFHKGFAEPQRLNLLLEGDFGLEKLVTDGGSLERLESAREKNIGLMQQYAEAINQIKASDATESAKKIAEMNLIKLINGLDDDIVGPLKEEMLAEVTTLVLRSRVVGAVMAKDSSSALQNHEMGLIGSQTLGNYKFVLQGQGAEGYLLKVYGKTGVAADMRFKLYNLADGSKGIFVENVSADDRYRKDFKKDFKKGIYSNMLKEIIEIGEQYSRDINNVVEITGAINNLETLQGLYAAIAGRRTAEEQEEVKRLSGIEEKNYYEHTEPLIEMLKKAIIEEMGSGEGRGELEKKLPDTLLVRARSGGGFSTNHCMQIEGDQIILISNKPVQSAGSSLEMRPEEAARLIREAAQKNYEKWCLLSKDLKTVKRILIRVPGRDSRGGHEFPLGEIAVTLPVLIKTLIISGKSIEEIIVQCDSYPELIEALGEDRVKLAAAGQADDELRSIYSPDLVIDFDTVVLGEKVPENTVKFPVARLWTALDRYGAMREILGSAKLTIPEAGEAILKRERARDGQIAIFVNPHSDSNKNDNVDSWVGLIQELVSKGYKVVLNSGKEASKDQAHTRNMLDKLKQEVESGYVEEFKGSINDLLNTFSKKIDGVITIDSGIFHVVHSLYSLPTVVFTTSNTLGWIPQEKEELLFKKIKYADFKYPPVVTEALQNLLEKDKKGRVESLAKSASSPWTFKYVFEHESVKLGVDDKEQYRAILGVCLLAVAYREVGNGKWERVIAHYFPLENEETGNSKKDYIQRLFKNSEGKSMLSGNGWQVQIIPSEDMPDVLRYTFQGWSISMSDIESSLRGLNNDLSFHLLPVNQGGKTVTIYYDGLDIRDQENKITSELSFKAPLSDKTETAKEDSVSSPVKVNIEKAKEYTIKLLKLFGYPVDLFGGIKRLENDKARSQVIDGKVYFNAYWISRLTDDEIERLAAHEVQHIATEELIDKDMKLGGLQEDKGYIGLMSRIGRQFDQIGEEKGDVLAKPREFYQEPWEALSLLRGYQIYLNQVARGAKTSPQPYEFIEAFTEDDLVFLDTGHLDKITKDFKAEVGTLGKITYEDLDSIGQGSDLGGIDMRSLSQHTVIQPMTGSSIPKQKSSLKVAATVPDKEWLEIERMASSGIAPSCERLREYLLSLQDLNSQIDKVLACIADILRQEEEKACCTESSLREILILLESDKPVNELKLSLAKIQIFAKEPQLID